MSRDLSYDGLRGWLLIIIACNHLFGSFVTQFTRTPLGFVSAAEGFVFLSGFVAYLVYGRLANNRTELRRKVWRRCLVIYGFHLSAILICFSLVLLFPLYVTHWSVFFNAANWFSNPVHSTLSAMLLLEHPGFHDILILYLVPMIFLPFTIEALKRGKLMYVVTASLLVWLLAQFVTAEFLTTPFSLVFSDIKLNVSHFDPFAWQIYFFMGVVLSYLKFDKGHTFTFTPAVRVLLLSGIGFFLLLKHGYPQLMRPYYGGHGSASLLYQFNLLLSVYLIMHLMRRFSWLFTLRYPVFIGQHALPVFAFHCVVIYFLLPWSHEYTTAHWYWDLLVCASFVALLALPAKLDQLWRARSKNTRPEARQSVKTG
ncbi:OpgC domain-containing protein [Pseudoalteromonas rubra]|uniref:OpgC domain-containing protein n=1 Tax=Pseudoalteromonas rubra TaxID=43658 RepID=UPI002DB6328F|nr:OpgC domain-containing protein [Pseudoalteromonas rubra]MEC4088741.1 OpgC domain-containing protein [Pseudoalteromonas rubra]